MTLAITVPGTNGASSGLPALSARVAGFPAANLFGLWLHEDGTVGATPTSILDSSGNSHNGAMFTSPSVTKSNEGYATGASLGFLYDTGYPATSDFTVVGVERNRLGGSAGTNANPVLLTTTGSCASTVMTGSVGNTGSTTRGILAVNHDSVNPDSGATAGAEIGLFNQIANSAPGWAGGSSRRVCRNTAAAKASWIAWALSVNQTTGVIIFKSQGQTYTISALSDLTTWRAGAGNIVLGMSHYVLATLCTGDVGMNALYSYAATEAQIDVLIAAAKKRMSRAEHNSVSLVL